MTIPTTPAVQTAVKVLDALSASTEALTLSEVSRRVDAPKSSVYRILSTLHATRLVELEGTGYRLGPKVLEYHAAYSRQLDLGQVFHRVASRIVDAINETVQLARLEGDEVVFIAKLDCSQLIRPATYVGRRVPAYATAVGKALLAQLSQPELGRLYPQAKLPALTPHTITTTRALRDELEAVRRRGYALTAQESTLNLCCHSAIVRDASGAPVAALSICMATNEPAPERRARAIEQLLWGARELSEELGWFEADSASSANEVPVQAR